MSEELEKITKLMGELEEDALLEAVKERLAAGDEPLAIIEAAFNGDVVYVGVQDGRHLAFLDGTDAPVGVHDEDIYPLPGATSRDRRAACIPAGGAEDV